MRQISIAEGAGKYGIIAVREEPNREQQKHIVESLREYLIKIGIRNFYSVAFAFEEGYKYALHVFFCTQKVANETTIPDNWMGIPVRRKWE